MSKDEEGGICMMTIHSACNCANCDAHVNTVDGEEKCFSTVAVKDTDDDNGECHQHSTKCTQVISALQFICQRKGQEIRIRFCIQLLRIHRKDVHSIHTSRLQHRHQLQGRLRLRVSSHRQHL